MQIVCRDDARGLKKSRALLNEKRIALKNRAPKDEMEIENGYSRLNNS